MWELSGPGLDHWVGVPDSSPVFHSLAVVGGPVRIKLFIKSSYHLDCQAEVPQASSLGSLPITLSGRNHLWFSMRNNGGWTSSDLISMKGHPESL